MKENLIAYFERKLEQMDYMESPKARHIFLDQAFGAVDFLCQFATPEEFKELEALWSEVWKPKFTEKVWG